MLNNGKDTKVENNEIKEYLIKFSTYKLDNCKLFTKVYGKNFAKRRLNSTLNNVYTNEFDTRRSGYCDLINDSIVICTGDLYSKYLTPQDLENNESLKATMLHESVHQILKKTKLECLLAGLGYCTGAIECYNNGEELGRGLNEGLTNWICNKAGITNNSYKILTNYLNILELAIGEENVMKLGKGGIKRNFPNLLSMQKDETLNFLAVLDEIQTLGRQKSGIKDILRVLENYKNINDLPEKDREKAEYEYLELNKDDIFTMHYKKYEEILNEFNLKDSLEQKIGYFKVLSDQKDSELIQRVEQVDIVIFNKYFKKDFDELIKADSNNLKSVPLSMLYKFDILYKLQQSDKKTYLDEYKKSYDIFNLKHFDIICSKLEEEAKSGNLTADKVEKLKNLACRGNESKEQQFVNKLAKLFCAESPEIAENLMLNLISSKKLNQINQYIPVKVIAGNKEVITYQKNGKITDVRFQYLSKKSNDKLFDFTLGKNEFDEDIIKNFLELKQQIMVKNPNSKITILDRLIVVDNDDRQDCYLIIDGKILPANVEKVENYNCNIIKDELSLPTLPNKGIFSKLKDTLKNRFFEGATQPLNYVADFKESKKETFRNNIKDLSSYDNRTIINDNTENKGKDDEIDKSL